MNYNQLYDLCLSYSKLVKGVIDIRKYTYYAITYHSTTLEGSTLTESQVFDLLEYGKTSKNKPFEHHQMVFDHFNALLLVSELVKSKSIISEKTIKLINATVIKNTGSKINTIAGSFDSSKGDYRLCSVRAGSRYFPDYKKVPYLMKNLIIENNRLVSNAKTFKQKCEAAFSLHFNFISIHPFADGNGRTSRLLMNYILAYFNLPMFYISHTVKVSYINALEDSRKKENLNPFYNFMFAQYKKFLSKEIISLKK